jgi:hypothetical protein
MPFEEFAGAGTAIDEQGESPGEDDIEALDLETLSADQLARIYLQDGPVSHEPLQLGAGGGAEGFMFCQPINEILRYHRVISPIRARIMA